MKNDIDSKHIRERLGVTQAQFASLLSVSQASVARWENGSAKPAGDALNKLRQLAETLNNKEEKKALRDLIAASGGIGAASALLTLGSIGAASMAIGVASLLSPAVMGTAAASALYGVLRKMFGRGEKKSKRARDEH